LFQGRAFTGQGEICWLGNSAEDLSDQGLDGVGVCGDGRNVMLGALGTLT
jgi:hypothetical protein